MIPKFITLWLILCRGVLLNALVSQETLNDFRYISFQDLRPTSDRFTDGNVTSFSRLLFDVSGDQLVVGARDTLYRMSFGLAVKETSVWEAPKGIREMCQAKGQNEEDCRNYVMVLHNYGSKLYACGTCAFSPCCSWRKMEDLTVLEHDKGVAKCPFNPHANITTLMTDNGQMFVGSPTDFSGSDPAILRVDVAQDGNRMLRTIQYNSKWLNDPQFVGSFERGDFVYFVFRETAVEYINCGKVLYSRIARVCKSDPGGTHILKDNWTSFLKARLNCSLPGEYPFYFDEVQGIAFSQEEGVLYATFTTPENSIHGSAICSFNMSSIDAAFAGPFKYQDSIGSAWTRQDSPHRAHYECKAGRGTSTRHNQLLDSSRYQLMDLAVQASTNKPLHFTNLERLQHISLDMIPTKLHEKVRIIYVSTEDGLIKKISLLPRTRETCIIEIWQTEPNPNINIKTIQYLKETDSLYVGTDAALMRISSQHCNRHGTKSSCLNSMDPYCGWNELQELCTTPPRGDTLVRHWLQNATECPNLSAPVDGGWSAWSDWFTCAQHGSQSSDEYGTTADKCMCRTRSCDNPAAKNGGTECTGTSIAVSNCTVNGGWTEWSSWSACSQTCGMAIKSRRRTCGNPKPAYGGRVCVGQERTEMYCSNLPPCPAPKVPSIDGGWGPWGIWSECSSPCGGGYKIRRRKCDDPMPLNGGQDCTGCPIEYESCNFHLCPEVKKMGPWTSWLMAFNGSTGDGSHLERRFRYSCKATLPDSSTLKIGLAKEETRVCSIDGSCQRVGEGNDDSGWSDWSPCTSLCGGGEQHRTKQCDGGECEDNFKIVRTCNVQACKGEWGCWSDWSPCTVSCGVGTKTRSRTCMSGDDCEGSDILTEACEMPNCDSFLGWSEWSDWTKCNEDNEKVRYRKCLKADPTLLECQGNERETRQCVEVITAGMLNKGNTTTYMLISIPVIIVVCGLSITFTWLYMKKHIPRGINNIQKSPCFDSYPNDYSSLPTKDYSDIRHKVKRQSSFNSSPSPSKILCNGNNTLTKSNNVTGNNTPKVLAPKSFVECDTATIKRNSHGLNNTKRNRSIEELKF